MVADPATKTVVALDPGPGRAAEGTWTWDGATWRHLDSAPPTQGPFAYDPGTRQVLAVVDAPPRAADEQTWAFGGSSWSRVATTDVVPVEYFPIPGGIPDQMVADFSTGSVVYLEQPGVSPGYFFPGDTYEWTAGAWQHPSSPTPLEHQGLLVAGAPPLLIAAGESDGVLTLWRWTGGEWTPLRAQG
jgi:hypothetical protein